MLSKDVREALQAELEHLQIRRRKITEKIDARIAAIEAVLGPEDDLFGPPAQLPLPDVPPRVGGAGAGDVGMRDTIRLALADRSLTPPEVTQALVHSGFRYSASTPLGQRVSNEMRRMAETGHLIRNGTRYSLPKDTEAGAA